MDDTEFYVEKTPAGQIYFDRITDRMDKIVPYDWEKIAKALAKTLSSDSKTESEWISWAHERVVRGK
jgi:hypothetical protein